MLSVRLALPLFAVFAVGCGPYLQYRAAKPAPTFNGRVAIEVRDSREPKAGGQDHAEVGMQTGAFGIPTMIKLDDPMAVTVTTAALVADAARAAGFGVVGPGDAPTAKVVIDVQRFWCTGYNPVYKADVTASLSVMDASGTQIRVPGMPLHAEDGGMNCKRIYYKTLSMLFDAARAMLSNPNIAAALVAK